MAGPGRAAELSAALSTAHTGRVVARTVSTIEDGRVDSFRLAVETGDGTAAGGWERTGGSSTHLLQTRLPGIGSAVRVWSVPGRPAEWPLESSAEW